MILMLDFILIVLFTTIITYIVNKTNHIKVFSLVDKIGTETRKIHIISTPKTGGISIFISLISVGCYLYFTHSNYPASLLIKILIVSFPIFAMAVYEDKYQNIPPHIRLALICFVSFLAFFILDGVFKKTGIEIIDNYILNFALVSLIATVIAYAGLINAINIIDGLNGLAILYAINSYMVIFYLSTLLNQSNIASIAFILIAINAGVLLFNFPISKLFLGDNGAYLNGFFITTLSLYLVNDNANVSPFLPLLISAYPVVETSLSIYRRIVYLKKSPLIPDASHMHHLIYKKTKKLLFPYLHQYDKEVVYNLINSGSAIIVFVCFILPTNLGLLFYSHTKGLMLFFITYCILYIVVYRILIRHKYLMARQNS